MAKTADTIAIYSRKSRYTGKGESIGNQIDLCREYIRTHYGDAAAEHAVVFEDEGFSGGNLNRPDFKKMMTAAKDRKFKAIVVYRLDRISRNISDFSSLIEELGRLGIDFVSIRESFDTSSPMGRAMMYIASVFSQLERETIAERIRDNMHELAKTGRWLGGTTPTGYASESVKSITVDGKTKKACKLKLLPDEAEIIYKIFDLYEQYDSLTMTETELLRQGIKTKTGRSFTRFSIKSILQNPVYLIADKDAYQYFVDNEAELFAPESDFDGVRGGKKAVLRSTIPSANGSFRWANTPASSPRTVGFGCRSRWNGTNPSPTTSPAATKPCSPACCGAPAAAGCTPRSPDAKLPTGRWSFPICAN